MNKRKIALWALGIFLCVIPWGLIGGDIYTSTGGDLAVYGLLVQVVGLVILIRMMAAEFV